MSFLKAPFCILALSHPPKNSFIFNNNPCFPRFYLEKLGEPQKARKISEKILSVLSSRVATHHMLLCNMKSEFIRKE